MLPDWADPILSADLPILRSRGEGQGLEYMREFPQQARELGKEIAAFASSNAGIILIGISDEGDLLGVDELSSPAGRDAILRRIEGICRGMVKPAVTPTTHFVVEDGKIVLALSVPRGQQPVYYCHDTPYVRHITQARPAEPHEVIQLVSDFLTQQPADTENTYGATLAHLSFPVAEVLIYSAELPNRSTNPWLEKLRSNFSSAASSARSIAAEDAIVRSGNSAVVKRLADAAAAVADYRLAIGRSPWSGFEEAVAAAALVANEINETLIASISQDTKGVVKNLARVRAYAREIADQSTKIPHAAATGRFEQVQYNISIIGANILHRSVFPLHHLPQALHERLVAAARVLHLFETRTMGGRNFVLIDDLQEQIEEAANELILVTEEAELVLSKNSR